MDARAKIWVAICVALGACVGVSFGWLMAAWEQSGFALDGPPLRFHWLLQNVSTAMYAGATLGAMLFAILAALALAVAHSSATDPSKHGWPLKVAQTLIVIVLVAGFLGIVWLYGSLRQ